MSSRLILPPNYADPDRKGRPKFCLECGRALSFVEGVSRWACSCGWINMDTPQPVANGLVILHAEDVQSQVRKAVGILNPAEAQIVNITRKHPPGVGERALMGGFVDQFESPGHAVIREAEEELGIDIQVARFLGCCFPLRYAPNRFLMNNLMTTWLVAPSADGAMVAKDDAEVVHVFRPEELTPMVFSSHNYVAQRWIDGDFGPLDADSLISFERSERVLPELGKFCVMCSTPMELRSVYSRLACPDTDNCNYVHWDSPVPYWRTILQGPGGGVLLVPDRDKDGVQVGWKLPSGVVPAYQSPSEAVHRQFKDLANKRIMLEVNVIADRFELDNSVDILMAGRISDQFEVSNARTIKAGDMRHVDRIKDVDKIIIEGYFGGAYDKIKTNR